MIKLEFTVVPSNDQWMSTIAGMRNPMNSWKNSDTVEVPGGTPKLGEADLKLMQKLIAAGTDHAKFLRMLPVMVDIVAPLYWWAEYDTYKVGTVANSCSKMHKIHEKEFTPDDFSHEHLTPISIHVFKHTIDALNSSRREFLKTNDKKFWWQMIQLLPSSYNQRRTVSLNYAVLRNMYHARKDHKLDCWRDFCKWIETLPYARELICGSTMP